MSNRWMPTLAALLAFAVPVFADPPKNDAKKPSLPTGTMDNADWLKAATTKLQPGEIDRMVGMHLDKMKIKSAPVTTDEQFVRRVYLDLTGKLPAPSAITSFVGDPSPDKRSKLIDKLLESDDYARHWSQYWRNVITSKLTLDFRVIPLITHFERWMHEQLQANKSWGFITREILTASGKVLNAEPDKNGQAFFLITRRGADATTEIAAETSRIFLGIQIQCAQCHDHPSDVWKREQFHQFAAFFARVRERPVLEEKKFIGAEVVKLPFGEHKMPGKDDPKKTTTMLPRFLDGKGLPGGGGFGGKLGGASDEARRKMLADSIVSKQNPWFAGAFVNRMWGELMGQAFYQPIDDLGPMKEAVMPDVLARVAGSFRGSDYDIKQLLRDIMISETYQRQIRPGESPDEHHLFASSNPVRMNSTALWQSLVGVLGPISNQGKFGGFGGPFARLGSVENTFKQEFGFDPSTKAEEIEGSVSQALLLMNSPAINQKIQAKGTNLLAGILKTYAEDDEAVRNVYLRVLARVPTDRELIRCREHIANTRNRAEAYEDLLWALINSTEFQMKR
jgi:hypothetical protein